jgi:outer membrane protein, multidrug efflux system
LFDTPQSLANELMSSLTFPLLNRRLLKSQLMQTEAQQKSAYVEYQKTVVNAFTEVYELMQKEWYFNQLKSERKKQIDVLQKSIQTSQLLFLNGRATFLEVVTAQENYLLAQIEWLKAMTSLTHTHIDLYKAIGGGLK